MVLLFKCKNSDEYSECKRIVNIELIEHFGEDTRALSSWFNDFTLLVNIPNTDFFRDIQKDNGRFFYEKNKLMTKCDIVSFMLGLDVLNPRTFVDDVLENLSFVPEIICKE